MNNIQHKSSTSALVVQWTSRILCILAILFVSMFALDSFSPGLTLLQQIGDFFKHMIPSLVILIILIIAWKHELVGGMILALIGLVCTPLIYNHNYYMNHSVMISLSVVAVITFPFVVAGVLFIVSYFLHHRRNMTV